MTTDTPTYDQLSALCAQMAAALEKAEPHVAYAMHTAQAADYTTRAAELSTVQTALTAYRTLSPDPVYAEAKNMLALLSSIDIVRGADPAEIAATINRARGEG